MEKNLLRVFFFFLFLSFFTDQKIYAQAQFVYDQLVKTNVLWSQVKDVDPSLKTKAATPLNEKQLIQQHLQEVEKLLRKRSISNLSAASKKSREKNLNTLHSYCLNGIFPVNNLHEGRQPYFIDDNNTYCAVGYLMKMNGGDAIAKDIRKTQNYSYLADIDHPKLMEWVAGSGLAFDELALIQPSYNYGLGTAITELHYNNTGDDVDEYIEVHQGSVFNFIDDSLKEVRLYDHSGLLYKTILISQMQEIPDKKCFYYHFPSNEHFADSGKIELAGRPGFGNTMQVFSDLTYNASGITIQDYLMFVNKHFSVTEDEESHPWNSITFCGMYLSTWNANVLPISIGTLSTCTPIFVPITLTSFTSGINDKSVHLKWETSADLNLDHFEIERSIDGTTFTSIGKTKANNIGTAIKSYTFDDITPNYINHYRLKLIDMTGQVNYSKILYVKNTAASLLTLKQTIVTNKLSIEIANSTLIENFIIYDLSGRTMIKHKATAGSQDINTSSFTPGKYLIRLHTKDGQAYTQQFIKQ